jgi:hypothetical protein
MSDDPATDWFGNPLDDRGGAPRVPVRCPYCGEGFTLKAAMVDHLAGAHAAADPTLVRRSRRGPPWWARLVRWFEGLRFLPLWFVLPLNLVLAVLVWMSVKDPLFNPAAAMAVRMSLLPSILLLAARIAGRKP